MFLSPFVAHKGEVCFCLHNVRCTSPTVNLFNGRIPWIYDPLSTHMITTASKSKTAKWFVDSCLLCTTPKYYVWWSFDLFLVFMWRSHIPKLEIILPSEVLVSSDKRSCRNVTFGNVLARQSSSFCNRALQAFALRDMKMAARKDCRVDQKTSYRFSFC